MCALVGVGDSFFKRGIIRRLSNNRKRPVGLGRGRLCHRLQDEAERGMPNQLYCIPFMFKKDSDSFSYPFWQRLLIPSAKSRSICCPKRAGLTSSTGDDSESSAAPSLTGAHHPHAFGGDLTLTSCNG
jgi:hypothetical protein